eukprot:jgi/Mesvir1/14775/Mv05416-RA.1
MLHYARPKGPQILQEFEEFVASCLQDDLARVEEVYDLNKPPTSRGLGCFWVAVHPDDDSILGMVGLQAVDVDSKIGLLRRMSISEKARRRGVGSQLLGQLESWAVDQGFHKITLNTNDFMRPACLFYEKHGFVESRREYDPADGLTMVYYEKCLAYVSESDADTPKRAA